MEPLTTGAIALLLFFGKKLIDWGISKAYDTAFNQLMTASPDTVKESTNKLNPFISKHWNQENNFSGDIL